jgi:hypothetical protein
MSARRRVLVPLLLVLGALVAAELGSRVIVARLTWRQLPPFGRGPIQREWLERSERELARGDQPPGYSRFDPVLGWTTEPGHVSPDGRVHVNARGLRSTREYAEPAPEGTRRMIVCGESFTFCEEVADADAWPARLEALEPSLEVLNYGVGGYGTDQAWLRVSRDACGPAEALVVGLMLENIGRNVNRYRPLWYPRAQPAAKPRFVLGAGGLELVPQPFGSREEFVAAVRSGAVFARLAEHEHWSASHVPPWLAWSAAARLLAARRAYAEREIGRLWSDTDGEPFRVTLALLASFRELSAKLGGARLRVLVFPTRADLEALLGDGRRHWSSLLDALAARGIDHLDLSGPLADAVRGGETVDALYSESHFSPLANDIVARALLARMTEERGGTGGR